MDGKHAKATSATRAVLYLRQSVAKEESISIDLQRDACKAYCQSHGYRIVEERRDPGKSGRFWFTRPGVLAAMKDLELGRADVIVLWRWSRLARDRFYFATAVTEAESHGGRIESATEPADTATSSGRLTRGLLSEFAAFESERIADGWKETHARRVKLGLPANGKERFGYRYSRKKKRHKPDPVTGPLLAECYRRYVDDKVSIYALVGWLNEQGVRTVDGYAKRNPETGERLSDGRWSGRTLRRVMDSGFAAGYITVGGELRKGRHTALIDEDTWNDYRDRRQLTAVNRKSERSVYLLSGLIRCACGSSMTGGQYGAYRQPKYRCKAAAEKQTHAGGYVMAHLAEAAVQVWLVERNERLLAAAPIATPAGPNDVDRLLAAIAKIEYRADALTDRYLDGEIPRARHDKLSTRYADELAALDVQLRTARSRERHAEPVVLPALVERWEQLAVEQRRGIMQHLIDHVEVTPGFGRAEISVHPKMHHDLRLPVEFVDGGDSLVAAQDRSA